MPDFGDDGLMGRLSELSQKIDPQTIMDVVREVVPPAMVRDVLEIVLDPDVQQGLAAVQESIANIQEIGFDLVDSLPSLVEEIRNSYTGAVEGGRTALGSLDADRIAALKGYAPQVAVGLAKVALARPEAQPLREKAAEVVYATFGKAYGDQPGAATVAVALQAIALKDSQNGTGSAAQVMALALELIVPEPIVAATRSTIEQFAQARGVEYEDELGRWSRDAASKTLLTGAAGRYAKATGLDKLPEVEYLAAKASIATQLGKLFEGVTGDWVRHGATPVTVKRAERNARTAFRAISQATEQKLATPEADGPAKPAKPTTRRGRGAAGPDGGLAA